MDRGKQFENSACLYSHRDVVHKEPGFDNEIPSMNLSQSFALVLHLLLSVELGKVDLGAIRNPPGAIRNLAIEAGCIFAKISLKKAFQNTEIVTSSCFLITFLCCIVC